jgi:chorismate lyase/3-hydroxybenzoate synthase
VTSSISLHFVSNEEFSSLLETHHGHILGAIAFGQRPSIFIKDIPFRWVDLPCLTEDTVWEVCLSEKPATKENIDHITISKNDDFLFGVLEIEDKNDLEEATFAAYSRLFDVIDEQGYPHLLRIWNYFSRINESHHDLERYRSFSI